MSVHLPLRPSPAGSHLASYMRESRWLSKEGRPQTGLENIPTDL